MQLVDSKLLESLGIPWCFREDSAKVAKKGSGFIINLDDKTGPGTHWTCARLVNDTLFYADPFGSLLNGWPPKELAKVGSRQVVNSVVFQRPKSFLCGYYCICFIEALNKLTGSESQAEFEKSLYESIV